MKINIIDCFAIIKLFPCHKHYSRCIATRLRFVNPSLSIDILQPSLLPFGHWLIVLFWCLPSLDCLCCSRSLVSSVFKLSLYRKHYSSCIAKRLRFVNPSSSIDILQPSLLPFGHWLIVLFWCLPSLDCLCCSRSLVSSVFKLSLRRKHYSSCIATHLRSIHPSLAIDILQPSLLPFSHWLTVLFWCLPSLECLCCGQFSVSTFFRLSPCHESVSSFLA